MEVINLANKLRKMRTRAKSVLNNKTGGLSLEMIVLIFVVLVIATALFIFRDSIADFLNTSAGEVNTLEDNISNMSDGSTWSP